MKILTFGEIMLRLKAPGHERFFQSPMLEATFGGGEANVAVSLANYGMDAEFLTVLPKNDIADACIRELRYFGVDTKKIVRGEGRMGIYYLEGGANQLPRKVVYDRAYSSIAMAKPGNIDWDKAFEGVAWFHITGITPAISESAMELSLESLKEAKKRNTGWQCPSPSRPTLYSASADMATKPSPVASTMHFARIVISPVGVESTMPATRFSSFKTSMTVVCRKSCTPFS